jgi:hypothetical protein
MGILTMTLGFMLVAMVVVVVGRRLMGRSVVRTDRRRRRAAVLLAVLVLMFCYARPFLPTVSWRGYPRFQSTTSEDVSIPVELADERGATAASTGATTVEPSAKSARTMPDRKRARHPLLLAAAGVTRAITGKEPTMEPAKESVPSPTGDAAHPPAAVSKRPAWIDAKPDRVDDAFQMAVSVGPYPTRVECDNELPAAVRDALQDYAETHLDHRARGIHLPLENLEVLPANVIAETYQETVATSFGPMQQLHARLTLDRRANEWVREQVRQALIVQRLWYVGVGAAGVLVGLAVFWACLRSGMPAHGPQGAAGSASACPKALT